MTMPRRILPLAAMTAAALGAAAPAASAESLTAPLLKLDAATDVAARDDVILYTELTSTRRDARYRIMVRRDGRSTPLGVPALRSATTLSLGDGPQGLTAVYTRCGSGDGPASCHLMTTPLRTGKERRVPNTRRAAAGAIDGDRVVAVLPRRASSGRYDGAGQQVVTIRGGKVSSRANVPRTSYQDGGRRRTGSAAEHWVQDLDYEGGTVALIVSHPGRTVGSGRSRRTDRGSTLWVVRNGRRPTRVDVLAPRRTPPVFLGVRLEQRAVVAYRGTVRSGSIVRYSRGGGKRLGSKGLDFTSTTEIESAAFDDDHAYSTHRTTERCRTDCITLQQSGPLELG